MANKNTKETKKKLIAELKRLEKYQKVEQIIAKESDKMAELVKRFNENQEAEKIKQFIKKK